MSRSPYSRTYSHYYIRNYITFEHPLFLDDTWAILQWLQIQQQQKTLLQNAALGNSSTSSQNASKKRDFVDGKVVLSATYFKPKTFLEGEGEDCFIQCISFKKQQHCCWFRKSIYCMSHWRTYCVVFDDALYICRMQICRYNIRKRCVVTLNCTKYK